MTSTDDTLTLVLAPTGKTGRRVARGLLERGAAVRLAGRSTEPRFDWNDEATWPAVLDGVDRIYLAYAPDLSVPGALASVTAFVAQAKAAGTSRIVLLSGRGEDEAQAAEQVVAGSGVAFTILRCSWFTQNFDESFIADAIRSGTLALPVPAHITEPFIDADDIAEIAVAALTTGAHAGELLELTGPGLLSFDDVVAEISAATGERVTYAEVPMEDYAAGARAEGVPEEYIALLTYLFTEVLDGRNESVTADAQRALGRPPKRFTQYAEEAARSAVWAQSTSEVTR